MNFSYFQLKIMTPKLGILLNEKIPTKRREIVTVPGFNPREKQAELDDQSKSFKIYKYGEKLYAKYNDGTIEKPSNATEDETNQQNEKNFEKSKLHFYGYIFTYFPGGLMVSFLL